MSSDRIEVVHMVISIVNMYDIGAEKIFDTGVAFWAKSEGGGIRTRGP